MSSSPQGNSSCKMRHSTKITLLPDGTRLVSSHAGFDTIIDVRSPSEFAHSHIPQAYNFPVLDDAQFRQIGTLYHEDSLRAKFLGASMACQNIAQLLQKATIDPTCAQILSHKRKILIYCARGGSRSQALYEVLKNLGLQVFKLANGYKGYRASVLVRLKAPHRFITLCGQTGCGKSEIIQALGEASIDLEALAHHYGSSFGSLATLKLGAQPTQKMFENLLESELAAKSAHAPLFIESESKKLGSLIVPKELYTCYQNSPTIAITAPLEDRIARITSLYRDLPESLFASAMATIKPYISTDLHTTLLTLWEKRDLAEIASILIQRYYDKVYKSAPHDYTIHHTDLATTLATLRELRAEISRG